MSAPQPALELQDLDVVYRVRGREAAALRGLTLTIGAGESYGLVGESGCGKSTTALAIVRYLPRNGRVSNGSIRVAGEDVLAMSRGRLRRLRAEGVSMVYQNPGNALNPSLRIGDQLADAFRARGDGRERASEALRRVQIADPSSVARSYPHQLSGGMQQRILIAMALANDPSVLILDEPTTGLDATIEADVLELIRQLKLNAGIAVLFISHNLGVIAEMCQRVGVLYAGRLVEEGPVEAVLHDPRHPYTLGLIRCIPRKGARKGEGALDTIPGFPPSIRNVPRGCSFSERCALAQAICDAEEPELEPTALSHLSRCHFHRSVHGLSHPQVAGIEAAAFHVDRGGVPVISMRDVTKLFQDHGRRVRALDTVSADIWHGETLGLVGESGSGKTTLARTLVGLVEPTRGTLELNGRVLAPRLTERSGQDRRDLQIVFQNPDSALNPRHTIRRILMRTLRKLEGVSGQAAEARLLELASAVRLTEEHLSLRPSQLSGGLKQRVAIARAFVGSPQLVVCDEPTSALDVSVQAAILNLLAELQAKKYVSYLFISHDLSVVRYLSDRIAVLYLGRLMELGPANDVFDGPHHPYTEALLSAAPTIEGRNNGRIRLSGEIPSATKPPSGCAFHTRCPRKIGSICEETEPALTEIARGHVMRCHIPVDDLRRLQRNPDGLGTRSAEPN